jgi:hypothetical protein
MRLKWIFISFFTLSLLFTSCYKQEDTTYLDEYDITLTYYDNEFDFKTYQNFIVRDSVMLYSDYLKDSEIEDFYTSGKSDKVREKIVEKFKSLGYTEVSDIEEADFAINPMVSLMKQEGLVYNWWWSYPGYWGWYGGWYYKSTNYYYYPPYWGWYPSATYYNYNTGSIVMEMVDAASVRTYNEWLSSQSNPNEVNPEDVPEILFRWTANIDGILGSDGDYNVERASRGFNEAFDQSPYLKK